MMPASQAASEGSPRQTGAEIDVIEWFGNAHPYGGLASLLHYWPRQPQGLGRPRGRSVG